MVENSEATAIGTTGGGLDFILQRLPHRPPFLWLDRVLSLDQKKICAEKLIPKDLDLFQGHYPDYPLMPGVLLCEAIFQAGGLLVGEIMRQGCSDATTAPKVPILTRIQNGKFKREVRPGDTIEIQVTLKEQVGPAWFLKGSVRVKGQLAVQVEFACSQKAA